MREHQVLEVSFDAIFGQKKFRKFLHLNPKGKVALRSYFGPIFKHKKINLLSRNQTSSKHHRRWLKVQRTCLKPFPTSERHIQGIKLRGRPGPKIVIFWRKFSSGVPGGCTYFSERPAPQTHPKGSYLLEKSCPTSLRYLVLEKSDFESTKNRDFIPPPR